MDEGERQTLRDQVQATIEEGRLGTPQFLRVLARATAGQSLERALEATLDLASLWFGGPPQRRDRIGGEEGTYLTELARWPQGQGAVITVLAHDLAGAPQMDLVLMGSRGALYFET